VVNEQFENISAAEDLTGNNSNTSKESVIGGSTESVNVDSGKINDLLNATTRNNASPHSSKFKQTNNQANQAETKPNLLSFLCWNVDGLMNKLPDCDFVNFITSFDVCCLQETFTFENFDSSIHFDNFLVFHSPAVKLSKMGRGSGGTLLLIKKSLADFVSVIDTGIDNLLSVRLSKQLFDFDKDIVFVGLYSHPEGSPYYEHKDYDCLITELEQFLLTTFENNEDAYLLIAGDLNARIGNWGLEVSDVDNPLDGFGLEDEQSFVFDRESEDKCVNTFGKRLIDLCTVFQLLPLNGYVKKGLNHVFTFLSEKGASVIDYFLCSYEFEMFVYSLDVVNRIESTHAPVVLNVQGQLPSTNNIEKPLESTFSRVKWDCSKEQEFRNFMASNYAQLCLDEATLLLEKSIDDAVDKFTCLLREASDCMRQQIRVGGSVKSKFRSKWYDRECECLKLDARRSLARYRRSKKEDDWISYKEKRNLYLSTTKDKKKSYNDKVTEALLDNIKDSKKFWSTVRGLKRKPKVTPSVDINIWKEHFEHM
jgi:hypothetical protein